MVDEEIEGSNFATLKLGILFDMPNLNNNGQ